MILKRCIKINENVTITFLIDKYSKHLQCTPHQLFKMIIRFSLKGMDGCDCRVGQESTCVIKSLILIVGYKTVKLNYSFG